MALGIPTTKKTYQVLGLYKLRKEKECKPGHTELFFEFFPQKNRVLPAGVEKLIDPIRGLA